jgi:hypothetical protein
MAMRIVAVTTGNPHTGDNCGTHYYLFNPAILRDAVALQRLLHTFTPPAEYAVWFSDEVDAILQAWAINGVPMFDATPHEETAEDFHDAVTTLELVRDNRSTRKEE